MRRIGQGLLSGRLAAFFSARKAGLGLVAVSLVCAPAVSAWAATAHKTVHKEPPAPTPAEIPLRLPPYTMKCFLDRDLVVNENLAGKPIFKDGQWQAHAWSADPKHPGAEIIVRQGANATCIVKQNVN